MSIAQWRTSTYSQGNSNCVECRVEPGRTLIRDTFHRQRGHLTVPANEWRAFLAAVRRAEVG
ncbi:DUF397 domain-containing protein [Spiractinospora alimapuensis]|uniref:DUF397 domain-containing protein n=1 Tax=Spiractinospora alimapuensis TaxID=2820884 RepID=UPI001F2C3274|nr:DUF397 domain-containing protein [Spiractinospora alimapuensis]QVQ50737.1 DUF397 domain-containing protein [Spiractinospora alimapuensis]